MSADTKDLVKLPIPREIYLAIMKVMTDENLDWPKACQRVAQLINTKSDEFKKAVDAKANQLYKKRHMAEQNKTINKLKAKFESGHYAVMEMMRKDQEKLQQFYIPCPKCGEPMRFSNSDEDWTTKSQTLLAAFKGWAHVNCQ